MRLVREGQQRRDVARRGAEAVGVEEALDRAQAPGRTAGQGRHLVAAMRRGAQLAGDEPAAESLGDRIALIGDDRLDVALAVAVGDRAEHQQAGHAQRVAGQVAAETAELALELRPLRRPLLQRVEDQAGAGVVSGDLEQVAVADPAERDPVVEEERPRVRRADHPGLEAALRVQQQLRVGRQLPARRAPTPGSRPAPRTSAGPTRRPRRRFKSSTIVADRHGGVGNRRVVGRSQEHPAALGAEREGPRDRRADTSRRRSRPRRLRASRRRPGSPRVEVTERPDPACRGPVRQARGAAGRRGWRRPPPAISSARCRRNRRADSVGQGVALPHGKRGHHAEERTDRRNRRRTRARGRSRGRHAGDPDRRRGHRRRRRRPGRHGDRPVRTRGRRLGHRRDPRSADAVREDRRHRRPRALPGPRSSQGDLQRLGPRLRPRRFAEDADRARQDARPEGGAGELARRRGAVLPRGALAGADGDAGQERVPRHRRRAATASTRT